MPPNFLSILTYTGKNNIEMQLFSIILRAVIEFRTGDYKMNPQNPKVMH